MKLVTGLLLTASVFAQSHDPLSSEIRRSYADIKNNLLKMAEKMPGDQYSFRPVPEIETFARRVAHIADANFRTCAGLKGEQRSLGAAAKTAKADLVAALRESFAYCDPLFESLNDSLAAQMVAGAISSPPLPGEQRSRLSTLWSIVRHSNEMYGYMSVYLRLKGIVPPSSEGR